LVLQHAEGEGLGQLEPALAASGLVARVARPDRGERVPESPEPAGLVVLGGPMSVHDAYPWLAAERALIRNMLEVGKPVLGICLGAEQVAAALGAQVRKARGYEIGWLPVTLTEAAAADPLFRGSPAALTPLHWHGDELDLPSGANCLASSAQTAVQAFSFKNLAWGLLFHLEATASIAQVMVDGFPDELSAAGLTGRDVMSNAARQEEAMRPLAERIFGRWAALTARP